MNRKPLRRFAAVLCALLAGALALPVAAQDAKKQPQKQSYRRQLGPNNPKVRVEGGKTYLWYGQRFEPPDAKSDKWYEFTGSLLKPEDLQFGIGKDSIRAIDDPMFVKPDDQRLLKYLPRSPYRIDENPTSSDEIMVIGYAFGDDARAYPIALLDRHELVNDKVGGKPVTVGW